ncbi:MAG TPA: sulfate ABC transporter substrate-binding protein [Pyrinomonadaceae bacterium]|nr:sulfate ABC transporter substrate-binding protein [Pyrinomonadaceae bacterium]
MRISTPKIGPGAMLVVPFLALSLLLGSGCLPKSQSNTTGGMRTITVYGFSIMKESLEKSIFPAFAAKWKQEHGEDVKFVSSFAGSETVTNQILQGVNADVAILSIERDVDRLQQAGFVPASWHDLPNRGIVNKTPFLILVRKGNPKGIHDFADLARPGVKLIHPDPVSSGGAQWSVLAIYGSELIKSEKETGQRDASRALQLLKAIWKNVISTPGSAREARTQFETGYADALITYEIDALLMKGAGGAVDIVVPESTIYSEHPAVMIERNVKEDQRPVVTAFIQYLWSDEAQRAFVKNHFRAASNDSLNDANKDFATIKMPFTVGDLGGWSSAYPEIIEHVFRDQVQKKQ